MFNSGPQTSSSTFTTLTLTIRPTFGSLPLQSLLFSGQTLTNVRTLLAMLHRQEIPEHCHHLPHRATIVVVVSGVTPADDEPPNESCDLRRLSTAVFLQRFACMQRSCWVIEYNRCSPTFLKSCILSLQSSNLNRRD